MANKTPADTTVAEQLSCAVDGELGSDSARFLLRRMQGDAGLNGQWERYTLIGDCMRHQYCGARARGLAASVAAQIAAEPAPEQLATPAVANGFWQKAFKPAAGFAVAASVAVMAVVGLRSQAPVETVDGMVAPVAGIPTDQVRPASTAPRSTSIDARLSRYLVRHNEIAPEGGRSGFVSYAHMVSNNAARDAENSANQGASDPSLGAAGVGENQDADSQTLPADSNREVPVQ